MITNNDKLNTLIELFGDETILNELAKAMDSKELHDDLDYINNNWDLELVITSYNKNDLYGVLDEMVSMIGADNTIQELAKAMDANYLNDVVDYISSMFDA